MKTLLTLPLFLLSLISFPSWSETFDDLVVVDGLYYKKFSDVPFTGRMEGIYQGYVKNGKEDGPWIFTYYNGGLWRKGNYIDGKENGYWVLFRTTGRLWEKGNYKDGKRVGRWVRYDSDGNLDTEWSGVYKDGVKISD